MEVTRQEFDSLKSEVARMQTALTLVNDRSQRNELRINKAKEEMDRESERAADKLDQMQTNTLKAIEAVGKQVSDHHTAALQKTDALTTQVNKLQINEARRDGAGVGKRELFFIVVAGAGIVINILQAIFGG